MTVFKTNDWSQADVDQLALYYGITNVEFKEYLRTLGVRNWDGIGTKRMAYDQILCEVADRNWCTVSCPKTSLNEVEPEERLICYPNPAMNTVRLSITDPEIEGVSVSDLDGREQNVRVRLENSSSMIIDISSLPSGAYIIKTPTSSTSFFKIP